MWQALLGFLAILALLVPGAAAARADDAAQSPADTAAAELTDLLVNGLIVESDGQWHQGDYRGASRANLMASTLDPTYEEGYDNSAWLTWSLGYDAKAIAIYEKAVAANPRSARLLEAFGAHYQITHRPAKALELYRRVLAVEPSPRAYLNIGHMHKALGDKRMALRCYEAAVRMDESFAVGQHNVSSLMARVGRLNLPFTRHMDYLSCIGYVQHEVREETGRTLGRAEARRELARRRAAEGPLYTTDRQRDLVEEATRPVMPPPGAPMPGMPGMGPFGPGGPGRPSGPDGPTRPTAAPPGAVDAAPDML
jgi:tetratricopeptide (TPR) repeat protein